MKYARVNKEIERLAHKNNYGINPADKKEFAIFLKNENYDSNQIENIINVVDYELYYNENEITAQSEYKINEAIR